MILFFNVEEVTFGDDTSSRVSETEIGGKLFNIGGILCKRSAQDDSEVDVGTRLFGITNCQTNCNTCSCSNNRCNNKCNKCFNNNNINCNTCRCRNRRCKNRCNKCKNNSVNCNTCRCRNRKCRNQCNKCNNNGGGGIFCKRSAQEVSEVDVGTKLFGITNCQPKAVNCNTCRCRNNRCKSKCNKCNNNGRFLKCSTFTFYQ